MLLDEEASADDVPFMSWLMRLLILSWPVLSSFLARSRQFFGGDGFYWSEKR